MRPILHAILFFAVSAAIFLFWLFHQSTAPWTPLRILGLSLTLISWALIATARIQLGQAFRMQAIAGNRLVTHGLYSRIRNPIYAAGLPLFLGLYLVSGNRLILAALVPVAILQFIRARQEAQVLSARFGQEYEAYRQQTWF